MYFSYILASSLIVSTLAVGTLDPVETRNALQRGAPILGFYAPCQGLLCSWMSKIADTTPLSSMNIPGTHDAATWNYSQATQDRLNSYTGSIPPAADYRCQEKSLFQALNDGIRVFDLRYGYGPDGTSLTFSHGPAVLDPFATLQDIVYGYYYWLTQNPTEAVLLSLMVEGGLNDEGLQQQVYDMLNTPTAQQFWVQSNGDLGTLGDARGKLSLLARFDFGLLPSSSSNRIGLHLSPSQWLDNGYSFELPYNPEGGKVAYIEDFYDLTDAGQDTSKNIQWKFNATVAHLKLAATVHPDQLFISFASATHVAATLPKTPKVVALGDGTLLVPGVDQKLLPWLLTHPIGRRGIVMLDFYDAVPALVEAVIGII